jgi:aspartyl-tRNA(Asn)/glutamyl-tRNA(Gln) amidotransferase subunit A
MISATGKTWMLSAGDRARLVRSGELSPVDLVEESLEQIGQLDGAVHAFCHLDAERALDQARQLERDISHGYEPGPLAGVPVAVKDLIAVAGMPMSGGSAAYRGFVPDENDICVDRLIAADAIILGKTTVAEFGYSALSHNPVDQTVRNPWNLAMTPGGSSAGSGAAVASGFVPLAMGSDGGGSVRVPASCCSLVGFKPSMGRVPLYPGCRDERFPGMSSWESLEHIGPLARSVEDVALAMSVIAGPDPRDRHSIPSADVDWLASPQETAGRARIALCLDLGYHRVDSRVAGAVERQAKLMERELGAIVEIVEPGFPDPAETFWSLVGLDTDLEGMRRLADTYGEHMSDELRSVLEKRWTAEEFCSAIRDRKAVVNRMWRLMENYDFILTPTMTVPPFPVDQPGPCIVDGVSVSEFAWSSFNVPFNLTGQPAISLPAGWTSDGLPIGLQLAGRHLADQPLLAFAAAYERIFDWKEKWPPMC